MVTAGVILDRRVCVIALLAFLAASSLSQFTLGTHRALMLQVEPIFFVRDSDAATPILGLTIRE